MWPSHPITSQGTCLRQTPWFASSSGFFLGQPSFHWYHHSPEPWHKTSFLHPTILCLPSPLTLPSHSPTAVILLIPEAPPPQAALSFCGRATSQPSTWPPSRLPHFQTPGHKTCPNSLSYSTATTVSVTCLQTYSGSLLPTG